jgi:hypothetical protein
MRIPIMLSLKKSRVASFSLIMSPSSKSTPFFLRPSRNMRLNTGFVTLDGLLPGKRGPSHGVHEEGYVHPVGTSGVAGLAADAFQMATLRSTSSCGPAEAGAAPDCGMISILKAMGQPRVQVLHW